MILKSVVHHPNDVTIGYLIDVIPEKLHHYFKLPGKFVCNYPTRIIRRDGTEREMDWLMLVEADNITLFENILINVEFQSSYVSKEKIKVIADYRDYSKTFYGLPVLSVIVIMDGFESSELEYRRVSSDILKPEYIHMECDEISEKLNNIEEKIINHKLLIDDEALDMVFLSMFAPKDKASSVCEKIVRLFPDNKSIDGVFRADIAFALTIMVRKYFDLTPKGKELLELLKPEVENSRLRNVIEYEVDFIRKSYEKEIAERDNVIAEKDIALSAKDSTIAEKDIALSAKDSTIAEKDDEINLLKAKLKENGIE